MGIFINVLLRFGKDLPAGVFCGRGGFGSAQPPFTPTVILMKEESHLIRDSSCYFVMFGTSAITDFFSAITTFYAVSCDFWWLR